MQLFSKIIWFAEFTDPIRDGTDICRPDGEFRALFANVEWGAKKFPRASRTFNP